MVLAGLPPARDEAMRDGDAILDFSDVIPLSDTSGSGAGTSVAFFSMLLVFTVLIAARDDRNPARRSTFVFDVAIGTLSLLLRGLQPGAGTSRGMVSGRCRKKKLTD